MSRKPDPYTREALSFSPSRFWLLNEPPTATTNADLLGGTGSTLTNCTVGAKIDNKVCTGTTSAGTGGNYLELPCGSVTTFTIVVPAIIADWSTAGVILRDSTSSNGNYLGAFGSSFGLAANHRLGGTSFNTTLAAAPSLNQWYWFALRRNGTSTGDAWINGKIDATVTPGAGNALVSPLRIAKNGTSLSSAGLIRAHMVGYWERYLTDDELKWLYRAYRQTRSI